MLRVKQIRHAADIVRISPFPLPNGNPTRRIKLSLPKATQANPNAVDRISIIKHLFSRSPWRQNVFNGLLLQFYHQELFFSLGWRLEQLWALNFTINSFNVLCFIVQGGSQRTPRKSCPPGEATFPGFIWDLLWTRKYNTLKPFMMKLNARNCGH